MLTWQRWLFHQGGGSVQGFFQGKARDFCRRNVIVLAGETPPNPNWRTPWTHLLGRVAVLPFHHSDWLASVRFDWCADAVVALQIANTGWSDTKQTTKQHNLIQQGGASSTSTMLSHMIFETCDSLKKLTCTIVVTSEVALSQPKWRTCSVQYIFVCMFMSIYIYKEKRICICIVYYCMWERKRLIRIVELPGFPRPARVKLSACIRLAAGFGTETLQLPTEHIRPDCLTNQKNKTR